MEIEKKCEMAKLFSLLSMLFFFKVIIWKVYSYNIGIRETWERKKEKKRESQKLSKWGVVKLVGSWKLKSEVDKGDVREREKKMWNMNVKLWSF